MMEAGAGGISDGSTSKTDAGSDEVVKTSVIGPPVEVEIGVDQVESEDSRVAEGVTTPIIAPATPLPVKETRDIRAPRTVLQCRLAKIDVENCGEGEECGSPCTPKQGVFDPFAPAPEDMCLAPKFRKKTGESRVDVARQLDFDSSSSNEYNMILGKMKSDDEKLLELVCGDILNVVVPSSTQLDEADKVVPEPESDGFKTPPLVPCFNGTANKCPDAPMKQGNTVSKRLHVDSRLCRKLEF